MELPTASEFFSAMLQPNLTIILFSIAVALTLPILLHWFMYRKSAGTRLPQFLILGTSGAGKTSLATSFETDVPATTRVSQTPLTITASLPLSVSAASQQYRAAADPTRETQPRLLLTDTPGHGKLRHHALEALTPTAVKSLTGLVFVVDAADLPASSTQIREVATYLHDVLLLLQTGFAQQAAKGGKAFPVLIAANKMDLFTALPEQMVQKALELEISEVRQSREKGLLEAGTEGAEERDWLGDGGESVFAFDQLGEAGLEVSVVGGAVEGAEGPTVEGWWQWVADQL